MTTIKLGLFFQHSLKDYNMCIAIYKPANKDIDKATLQRCFTANPDGAGFLYNTPTKVKIRKGFFDFDSFYQAYSAHKTKAMLIHFRIKTHGAVEVSNCHPFYVTDELGFIHNGIISEHGGNKEVSDTRDFNQKILRPLVKSFGYGVIHSPQIQPLVEKYIGYSKLVFMDKDGDVVIYNEQMGNWNDDVWFSNYSWKAPEPYEYKSTYKSNSYNRSTMPLHANDNLYAGQDAQLNKNFKHLKVGDVVNIVHYGAYGQCEIETWDGEYIQYVPFSYLDLIEDWEAPVERTANTPALFVPRNGMDGWDYD